MGFISEFKEFAVKGNVMDMAIGVIVAGAFSNIIAALTENIINPIIGIITGLFSAAGLYIGRAFGSRWQKPAQIAGGVVLILIGVKVLLEHLGFLA